jgi:hypothetical protein
MIKDDTNVIVLPLRYLTPAEGLYKKTPFFSTPLRVWEEKGKDGQVIPLTIVPNTGGGNRARLWGTAIIRSDKMVLLFRSRGSLEGVIVQN